MDANNGCGVGALGELLARESAYATPRPAPPSCIIAADVAAWTVAVGRMPLAMVGSSVLRRACACSLASSAWRKPAVGGGTLRWYGRWAGWAGSVRGAALWRALLACTLGPTFTAFSGCVGFYWFETGTAPTYLLTF